MEGAAAAAVLEQQTDAADDDVALHGLAHVIDDGGGGLGGGMLPKLQNCIDAIESGVSRVHIIDGRIPHCLLLEIFTNKGIGTAILSRKESRYYNGEQ